MRKRRNLVPLALGLVLGSCGPAPGAAPVVPLSPPEATSPGVATLVDDEGYFVTTEVLSGDVYPGSNVRCLFHARHAKGAGLYVGRLVDAAEEARLYVRQGAGPFETVRLEARAGQPLRGRLAAALRQAPVESGVGPVAEEFLTILHSPAEEPSEAPESPAPEPRTADLEGGAPAPRPGAPLETWAGESQVFVEFRSVEAAYRFSGIADGVAGHLLRVAGDGRDYRTLWLALHHLTLPMVWRTNPSAEKGVGALALLVDEGARRGAADVALLLRVTRADLHESQTRVGLALAARPDHLWRPDDDFFPELRDPRAARTTVGDVEVIATSGAVLGRVQGGSDRTARAAAAVAEARRHADEEPPGGHRALFAYVPDTWGAARSRGVGRGPLERRQRAGLRALAWHLTGLRSVPPEDARAPSDEERAAATEPLAGVRWLDVHTDAAGATVRIETRDGKSAQRIAHALIARPPDAAAAARICATNLRDLAPVALVERQVPDLTERCFVWLGWAPVCPCGGKYRAHPITGTPSCSLHGTVEALQDAGTPRRPRIESMERNNTRVTFRLAIDWSRRE